MKRALVGHTGFVGGNLKKQALFSHFYRSTDIGEIHSQHFDMLVCCGARAEKWKANRFPDEDRAHIESLISDLRKATAKKAVLISTVDVFQPPLFQSERDTPEEAGLHAYGKNRLELEQFFRKTFDTLVVRLPALFGEGLKKNALFDLMTDNQVDKIHPEASFQFYWVGMLWQDIERALAAGLDTIHLVTEPIQMGLVASSIFHRRLVPHSDAAPRYDLYTRHANIWGRASKYIRTADEICSQMADYAQWWKSRTSRETA